MKTRLLLTGFFLTCIILTTEAQLLNSLKNKAQQAANKALEKKLEKELDKAAEKQVEKAWMEIFGEEEISSDDPEIAAERQAKYENFMKSLYEEVETADVYTFDALAKIEITAVDDKGRVQDPFMMDMLISQSERITGSKINTIESQSMMTYIMDQERGVSVILMDNQDGTKSSMAYKQDVYSTFDSEDQEEDEELISKDAKFTKTGKSKEICGIMCDEYITEDEEYRSNVWVSQENVTLLKLMQSNNETSQMKNRQPLTNPSWPTGNVMAIDYFSKKDKSEYHYIVKELHTDRKTSFKVAEYPNLMLGANQ